MAEAADDPKNQDVIQAATVIIFRHGRLGLPELLMVQRSKHLSFAGAASVFPGGKVHQSDLAIAATLTDVGLDEAAARVAGIREVLEETGLVIGTHQRPSAEQAIAARAMLAGNEDLAPVLLRFGWTLDIGQFVPFAHWVPRFKPGRIFDTRFYLADLGTGQVDLSPDFGENTRLFWVSARDALSMIESREIQAIYPTRRNLERLAQFTSFGDAQTHAFATPITTVLPWIEHHDGVDMLCIPEEIGYPVTIAPLAQIHIA